MANKAILLVEVALGKSAEVICSLKRLECVKSAERVTPPYDVIATVEVEPSQAVERQLGMIDGITRVAVCRTLDSARVGASYGIPA
ncbi:MAG: hypothetical protein A2147_02660 [Chloroflexi bacterium RBG_16_57_8]|nr:MAG: hypothetical protein A2147_02660 [Chloroflexi bacterium RBG_16_57_8]